MSFKKSKLFRNIAFSAAILTSFATPIHAEDEISAPIHVRVFDNGECTFFKLSSEITVGELLEKNGIVLEENDKIDQSLSDNVENEMRIKIERAKIVNITINDKIYESFKTDCETIGNLISELKKRDNTEYILASEDLYSLMKIENDMDIALSTVKVETYSVDDVIPFKTIEVEDDNLEKGVKKVTTEGENGIKTTTFERTFVAGKLESNEEISSEITKEPINEVIAVGTYVEPVEIIEPVIETSNTVNTENGTVVYSKELSMNATGYSSADPGCGAYTASGMLAKKGVVAVDKSVIPLGTKLYIPGYGSAIAADTGGAIKGNRIDLCFDTRTQACQFGRKNITVYVLA